MSHVRTQIRDQIATTLEPLGTIYKSRSYPLKETTLPVILVYTSTEEIETVDFSILDRRLALVVEVVVQATVDVDTEVDDLFEQIEAAIAAEPTVNGLALEIIPARIEVVISTDGAQPIARGRLEYSVLYRTDDSGLGLGSGGDGGGGGTPPNGLQANDGSYLLLNE